MHRERSSVGAQFTSNWIEVLVIPVASAIMEALPIALALQVLVEKIFFASNAQPELNVASVALVLLGLHWWMLWRRTKAAAANVSRIRIQLMHILSVLVAFAFLLWTNPAFAEDSGGWTVMLFLTAVVWYRSYSRTRPDEETNQLVWGLKVGFLLLLGVMFFALTEQSMGSPSLNRTLMTDLPIFFLSGLLALSFKRISILKQEQARQSKDPGSFKTGRWITGLALTWVAVIIGGIAFEALPPEVLASVVNVILGLFISLLSLLAYLFSLLNFGNASQGPSLPDLPKRQLQPPSSIPVPHTLPPTTLALPLTLIGFGCGILLVVILMLVILKRRVYETNAEEGNEVRENLDKEKIQKERRKERNQRTRLEALDPSSARARYRELLTSMATQGLSRRADETPAEYQARLLTLTQVLPEAEEQETPADQEILAALTQDYTRERYGAKPLTPERRDYLRQWLPSLLRRLVKKAGRDPHDESGG